MPLCRLGTVKALPGEKKAEALNNPDNTSSSSDYTMNSLRIARSALRARPTAIRVAKRGYADAVPDKIKLSLALPHQVRRMAEKGWQEGICAVSEKELNADMECVVHLQEPGCVRLFRLPRPAFSIE